MPKYLEAHPKGFFDEIETFWKSDNVVRSTLLRWRMHSSSVPLGRKPHSGQVNEQKIKNI